MSKFPKQFGPDVEVHEVDLDREDVRFRGDRLTEARAEAGGRGGPVADSRAAVPVGGE